MECQTARLHLLDAHAGRLALAVEADLRAHLDSCEACAHENAVEQLLTEVLEHHLPQHAASVALKRRLAAQWPSPAPARHRRWRGWSRWLAPVMAAALLLVVATVPVDQGRRDRGLSDVMGEAVNDHLRVLQPDRPLGILSDQSHQVRPWLAGRLDFAPVMAFRGDAEFPLKGGSVEYFLDRRAAVFVYGRRLHTISLFVFRPEGIPLPAARAEDTVRGFNVMLWRSGDMGYALVSDLNTAELRTLAERLSPPS